MAQKKQCEIIGTYRAMRSTHCITPPIYRGISGRNYKGITVGTYDTQQTRAGERAHSHAHTTAGTGAWGRAAHPQRHRQDTETTARRSRHTTRTGYTQKKEQKSTQKYIEVCYSSSVEHKGTDHTVAPDHSTCSPQRGHGTRHQSLRCVLFCVQAGHGIAVGTTQTQNAMRGEEGAAFLPIKYKKFLPFRYAKQGRRLGNGSETEN